MIDLTIRTVSIRALLSTAEIISCPPFILAVVTWTHITWSCIISKFIDNWWSEKHEYRDCTQYSSFASLFQRSYWFILLSDHHKMWLLNHAHSFVVLMCSMLDVRIQWKKTIVVKFLAYFFIFRFCFWKGIVAFDWCMQWEHNDLL